MFDFQKLLTYGYFPPELPPCFSSADYGANSNLVEQLIGQNDICSSDRSTSVPLRFSAYKSEASRRRFAVANPFHFAMAAKEVVLASNDLYSVFDRSSVSLTKPLDKDVAGKSFLRPSRSVVDTKRALKRFYSDHLYEVRLDVQSFFGTIYTHSIAWAIHSKEKAKADRGKNSTLCGNILDKCMRDMNDGQTNGILAGNDISRIMSEVILCTVDGEIEKRLGSKSFRRFVDDYFFFANSGSEVEQIVSTVRQTLADYELELNESKTKVIKSPLIFDNRFVDEVRGYFGLEPIPFLEHIIFAFSQSGDMRLLRYGLKVLQRVDFSESQWLDAEPYLLNIWMSCPSLSEVVIPIFEKNVAFLRKNYAKRAIYSIIDTHLPLGNDLEVIWALWGAVELEIRLSQPCLRCILDSDNWLAIVIALDMINDKGDRQAKGIKPGIEKLRDRLKKEYFSSGPTCGMCSEVWLLAYEASKNKWLNTGGSKTEMFDEAKKDEFFKELLKEGISFYSRQSKPLLKGAGEANSSHAAEKNREDASKLADTPDSSNALTQKPQSLEEILAMAMGY